MYEKSAVYLWIPSTYLLHKDICLEEDTNFLACPLFTISLYACLWCRKKALIGSSRR